MKRGRSLVIMVVLPALVSLAVTLLILTIWDAQKSPEQRVIVLPTDSGTALIPPRATQPDGGSSSEVATEPGVSDASSQPSDAGCQNPTHDVVAGDTLLGLSAQYGVSLDDLIAMNKVVDPGFDPDLLVVGQTLVIPTCGIPTQTIAPTSTDTLVPTRDIPTPIATGTEPAPGTISVKIARVLNIGDITREAVEIVNTGSTADLKQWTLSDGKGHAYAFPAFSLFKGGGVTIYSGVGQDTPIKLYWGMHDPLWEIGDSVYLYDADGKLEDKFEITKQ